MQYTNGMAGAITALFLLGFYPQAHAQETFKSAEFLTWKRSSQEFYIDTTIGMASLIVNQNDKAKGKCLSDWYFADPKAANDYVLSMMRQYPEYHPRGTIAAIIEKRCGSLTF